LLHIFYIFVIALTNNLDNLGARIAYSLRGIKITTPVNLWISIITFAISAAAASSGTIVSGFLGKQTASVIAMLLLSAIGSWMMFQQYAQTKDLEHHEEVQHKTRKSIFAVFLKPDEADVNGSKDIDFREATVLAVALSINNVGGGLSAGMIGLSAFWIGLLSAALSFTALWAGNYIADFFAKWNLSRKAVYVAGLLLIAIGIEQLL
jgi:putative sporulation protein YtaF